MPQRILVLGGGTGGTLNPNRLRRALDPDRAEITVVDQDGSHVGEFYEGAADGQIIFT